MTRSNRSVENHGRESVDCYGPASSGLDVGNYTLPAGLIHPSALIGRTAGTQFHAAGDAALPGITA
jgi:hypothetical protein